jgi:HSF-type DNA-binding
MFCLGCPLTQLKHRLTLFFCFFCLAKTMSDKTETNSCDGTSTPVLLVDSDGDSGGSSVYKYRDFSSVAEDDEDIVGEAGHVVDQGPVPNPARPGSGETSIRVQKFPVKLYAILAQKEFHDIISWMPHGRSWKVLKPNVFESLVMPLFFEYSNYHSFNRLVNAWSFRRVSSGADRGSYYHEVCALCACVCVCVCVCLRSFFAVLP